VYIKIPAELVLFSGGCFHVLRKMCTNGLLDPAKFFLALEKGSAAVAFVLGMFDYVAGFASR
jgi:hypothetical protein